MNFRANARANGLKFTHSQSDAQSRAAAQTEGVLGCARCLTKPQNLSARNDYIRFETTDFNGKSLSKIVPARHMEEEVWMYNGVLAYGANAQVVVLPEEAVKSGLGNSQLLPDWTTLARLPYASGDHRTQFRVICELSACRPDVGPSPCCPRTICRKMLEELAAFQGRGLELLTSTEQEFTICTQEGKGQYEPAWEGFDSCATLQTNECADLAYEIQEQMFDLGIDLKTMNAEYGEGQLNATMAPLRGVQGPDNVTTFRTGVKEICQKRHLTATFFTRPFGVAGIGNSGHLNFSLWEGDRAVTPDASSEHGISQTMQHFLAGLIEHAAALEAICAPTPACYTRHGNWAPSTADWGIDDRLTMVRVKPPNAGAGKDNTYLQLRLPSAAANPYLVVAALVAAGLDGLRRSLPLPAPRGQGAPLGKLLPNKMADALKALDQDQVLVASLGQQFVRWYAKVKKGEAVFIDKLTTEGGGTEDATVKAWQKTYLKFV
eukprot:TRINITY_DN80310_c0_g1_i1.p1 TRINITY_DN80310_c0_g1~~TRINITY_DN80310_c0_g1_i1.p1  ORF type:complete len:516 (+),score=78.62 TRINITY_DN80310_c0_g1_i1:76-1548(+)